MKFFVVQQFDFLVLVALSLAIVSITGSTDGLPEICGTLVVLLRIRRDSSDQ